MAAIELDRIDKLLLNNLQSGIPLVRRPFAVLAEPLGIGEDEAMARLSALKQAGFVRQVSAIFDTRTLDYQSTLVAMQVPGGRLERAAEAVNGHPGVSHNYRRDHSFNLWFTIAVPPHSSLARTVDTLHDLTGAESTRLLPTLKLFKIGVKLDMTGDEDPAATAPESRNRGPSSEIVSRSLTAKEVAVIRELQKDLEVAPEPFTAMADRIGIQHEELLEIARQFLESGRMRRFAAVLHHRRAGFRANAMVVWKVPEKRIEEVGDAIAAFNAVSHCYQRPSYPDWPFNIFSMIHGHNRQECESVAQRIGDAVGVGERASLYSTHEYKKVRVRLFDPEFEAWDAAHLKA